MTYVEEVKVPADNKQEMFSVGTMKDREGGGDSDMRGFQGDNHLSMSCTQHSHLLMERTVISWKPLSCHEVIASLLPQ